MYIDAHCHLADARFDESRDAVLRRARQKGVTAYIQGGVGPDDWRRQLELSGVIPGFHPCFGLHPWWVAQHDDAECDRAFELLMELLPQSSGLGELGLDWLPRWDYETHPRQERLFRQQLTLAREADKPLVLHLVRSHIRAVDLLRDDGVPARGGLVHGFSGSWELAQQYLKLGLIISVGGRAAGPNAKKVARAIRRIPAERLVIESDAPDQPPPQWRGRLNEPLSLWDVARRVGELRDQPPDRILRVSARNLKSVFQLE